jgi:EspG family
MPELVVGRRVLSLTEFDVVWRALGLGAPPVVLQLPSPGRTHTERRRVEAEVWTALRERGLADVAGPEPGLDRSLRMLAAPSFRVEVRAWGALTVRAAMADADDHGVLARRHDDTVVVEACTSIPGAVVGLLTSSPAGPGQAATVPGAQLEAALRQPAGAGLRAGLVDRGVDREQAGLMARMLHGIDGRAQIAVLVPDRWGVLHRSGGLVEVLDASRGRYLMTRTRSADGTSWTSVAPVDDRRLRQRLAELLEQGGLLSPGRRAASVAGLPR